MRILLPPARRSVRASSLMSAVNGTSPLPPPAHPRSLLSSRSWFTGVCTCRWAASSAPLARSLVGRAAGVQVKMREREDLIRKKEKGNNGSRQGGESVTLSCVPDFSTVEPPIAALVARLPPVSLVGIDLNHDAGAWEGGLDLNHGVGDWEGDLDMSPDGVEFDSSDVVRSPNYNDIIDSSSASEVGNPTQSKEQTVLAGEHEPDSASPIKTGWEKSFSDD